MRCIVQRSRLMLLVLLISLLLAACGGKKADPELAATGLSNLAQGSTLNINNAGRGTAQGQLAPDFSLQFADSKVSKLSDWQGKPVILNFWATWCPPCREEMPSFVAAHNGHPDEVVIVAVNAEETAAQAAAFASSHAMTFPVVLDERGDIQRLYNVRGLPTTIFIDRTGHIAGVWTGLLPQPQLEQVVQDLVQ
mgnify:CR=1 FL=1